MATTRCVRNIGKCDWQQSNNSVDALSVTVNNETNKNYNWRKGGCDDVGPRRKLPLQANLDLPGSFLYDSNSAFLATSATAHDIYSPWYKNSNITHLWKLCRVLNHGKYSALPTQKCLAGPGSHKHNHLRFQTFVKFVQIFLTGAKCSMTSRPNSLTGSVHEGGRDLTDPTPLSSRPSPKPHEACVRFDTGLGRPVRGTCSPDLLANHFGSRFCSPYAEHTVTAHQNVRSKVGTKTVRYPLALEDF